MFVSVAVCVYILYVGEMEASDVLIKCQFQMAGRVINLEIENLCNLRWQIKDLAALHY
jgi:hypothetical protein